MESVINQLRREVRSETEWEEVEKRVEAYLVAWRVPVDRRKEMAAEIIAETKVQCLRDMEAEPMRTAINEADERLQEWLRSGVATLEAGGGLAPAGAASTALLWEPQRPLVSDVTRMEPSLRRLPSFRMVAGWAALIGGAILTFIFTH